MAMTRRLSEAEVNQISKILGSAMQMIGELVGRDLMLANCSFLVGFKMQAKDGKSKNGVTMKGDGMDLAESIGYGLNEIAREDNGLVKVSAMLAKIMGTLAIAASQEAPSKIQITPEPTND